MIWVQKDLGAKGFGFKSPATVFFSLANFSLASSDSTRINLNESSVQQHHSRSRKPKLGQCEFYHFSSHFFCQNSIVTVRILLVFLPGSGWCTWARIQHVALFDAWFFSFFEQTCLENVKIWRGKYSKGCLAQRQCFDLMIGWSRVRFPAVEFYSFSIRRLEFYKKLLP